MAILINTLQQALIEDIKNDARAQNSEGVSIDQNADGAGDEGFCLKVPLPVKNFEQLVPVGSERNAQMEDMLRSTYVPLIRRTGPIQFQNFNLRPSPPITFTTASEQVLCVLTILPQHSPTVDRSVTIAADLSAYSTATSTEMVFWVTIDGAEEDTIVRFPYFFNEANSHRCMSAKWIATLPARCQSVTLKAARTSGSGTLTLNDSDFASLCVWG